MDNFYLDYCFGPSFVKFIEIQRVVRLIQTQSIVFFFLRTNLLFWVYISLGGYFFFFSIKAALNRDICSPSVDIVLFLRF